MIPNEDRCSQRVEVAEDVADTSGDNVTMSADPANRDRPAAVIAVTRLSKPLRLCKDARDDFSSNYRSAADRRSRAYRHRGARRGLRQLPGRRAIQDSDDYGYADQSGS